VMTMKSRVPKRTCVPGIQLMPWPAIRSLMKVTKHAKGPYLVRQLSVFRTAD
jgi:hypothetical protein